MIGIESDLVEQLALGEKGLGRLEWQNEGEYTYIHQCL
ncbi:hypothetical protein PSEUDO9AG_10166 [Pseudomonas sp. 9Ag]|nr:hypothetical protein PSEUDO9AG_10166 [Pseudomonas sp. 9Ag]